MIRFDGVTITYADASAPAVRDVDLDVPEGELWVVVGPTGSGKSTLLGAINGLVPHFTGGELRGRVAVDGRSTHDHPPRALADLVGYVTQDPLAGCVTDTVEEEIAYGMEQLAIAPNVMRTRVEEMLDLFGLAELRSRALVTLSGGQLQRTALASALAPHPRVLVLDEPTSALDPTGAEEVLAAITRLVHDVGITVVMAEHRLERVVQHADAIVEVRDDGSVGAGAPVNVLARTGPAPPIVQLGRAAGWDPLPLSIRDARRRAEPLRVALAGAVPPDAGQPGNEVVLDARHVVVRYGAQVAVREADLQLRAGEIVALMGRNGAGKSSLLWALQGSGARQGGKVRVANADPHELDAAAARALVGLVPQSATDLLYLDHVGDELAQSDKESGSPAGRTRTILDGIVAGIDDEMHPRDCSEGQRLALVLAIQLAAAPRVVLLDEPTRGLDYRAKEHLARVLRALADEGRSVVVSTHDVEFAATATTRALLMAEGEIVADGPTAEIAAASPAFAPQVARILAPLPFLTVAQVEATGVFDAENART